MRKGWEGAVLKLLRGRDFRLTVLEAGAVNARYHRLVVDDGGLLAACGTHPTMWVRLWFDDDGRPHQRAYTVVDPDPELGRFTLEFALHDGCAARWAQAAHPGETIDATVQGTDFRHPDPAPRRMWLYGDLASLPAVNAILDSFPQTPAQVWLEHAHEAEQQVPVRARAAHEVGWVPRSVPGRPAGEPLVDVGRGGLTAADVDRDWFWLAAEARTTRELTAHLRSLGVPKERIHAMAYWRAS